MNREEYENVLNTHRVPVSQLRSEFDPSKLPFTTTAEMEKLPNEMIGQERAEQAMDFGLTVEQTGYNLFVVGPAGTGRMTYALDSVEKKAKTRAVPEDWCYVYNFENPDMPLVISFPAGQGQKFQREIESLLVEIESEIRAYFSSEMFEKNKRAILDSFREKVDELWAQTDGFASEQNYKIERTQMGINTIPLRFGRPMSMQEYEQLSQVHKDLLKEKERLIEEKIQDTVHQIRKMDEELRKQVNEFMKKTTYEAVNELFLPLKEVYRDHKKVLSYLDAYFHDVVEHFFFFISDENEEDNVMSALIGSKEQQLHRYTVNLFVNNKKLAGAPVIYETSPTYQNLFGKVEYRGQLGSWVTDFTYIKPGVLHAANGGYLILQAAELLQHPNSWTRLKRALQNGKIQIENPYEESGAFPASAIKPEPIPLNVKVVIIGSYYIYDLLSGVDEDFHKLFKVKVEFNTVMKKDDENSLKMARFVKNYCEQQGLLPFHQRAIAKMIDYSSRLVEDQSKLTTRFHDITKLLVESSYWAKKSDARFVDDHHVLKALSEQVQRSNYVSQHYRDLIRNETIMVDTSGFRIGQINGLAVMGTRDSVFGIPTKITAQTFAGKAGIMNIEREAALSGQIHNKGLMILTGYLSGEFAKNKPLPLSASITFEQTYSPIDGDSASSTELYVLFSSLAEVPIHQGIAVTGSVNQWGEIQAIGGVNEKIEGFYEICKEKGLTGDQGVIIPKQNVKNLMLHSEVVDAVCHGRFHIWAVSHITEGIEILTGIRAGNIRGESCDFPEDTIFQKVDTRFKKIYESALAASNPS
ncbi:Lon protease family protein [Bacillus dakarensis]|uniref:Lon protease family protein n=1 Tax=Robertmurraya dakarensis TaxID=1926278 RepID=UPI0009824292|nr:ATP-binding protein [Bacillus dakarensis]